MVFNSLSQCVVFGGGSILLITLLSAGQPIGGQRLLDSGASLVDVVWQRTNPLNPFMANEEVVFPEKNPDSYFLKKAALAILDREADRMFAALRREQEDWLRRYTPVVSEQWRRQTGEFLFYDAAELARRGVLLDDEKDDQKDDQKDDEYPTDDEVVTDDLNQRMEQLMVNPAPAPQAPSTEAPAAAAREDFTVERSGAEEEEKKAEETNEPPHLPRSQMLD